MKKFTSILLFTVLMIPVLAQYEYHKQSLKAAIQNQVYLIQPLKSGTPAIKLDSVIAMKYSEHLNPPFTTPVKEFYEYDNTYRLTQITLKAWNQSTKEFSIIGKKEFFYNPEGLIGSIIFDMMTAQSLNFSYNYTYDATGRLIKFTQNFTNADLNLSDLIFTYNDLGKLSEIKNYFETKQYRILNNILVFSYNNAGELSDFKFVWDDAVAYQTFYEWNSENKLLTESFEDYFWGDKTRTEYTYNSIGDRIKSSYSNWENSELKSSGFDEYFYSDFNSSDLAELQNFAEYFYNPIEFKSTKLISEIAHYVGSTFIGKTEYYYSPVTRGGTTGVNNLNTADVNVYPNLATDQITFTWNQNFDRLNLKLFQVTGACVMDREISSNENVPVKNLQKGMYLYKLSNGNQLIKSGKLIKD